MSHLALNRYALSTVAFALVAAVALVVFIAMLVTTGDGHAAGLDKLTRDAGQLALAGFKHP